METRVIFLVVAAAMVLAIPMAAYAKGGHSAEWQLGYKDGVAAANSSNQNNRGDYCSNIVGNVPPSDQYCQGFQAGYDKGNSQMTG